MSVFDEIRATSNEYNFSQFVGAADIINSLSVINCSHELYRDTFSLIILNFTRNKNGYYWCQLSINNTLAQPSYHAKFFVGEHECITDYRYYRLADLSENRCAQYVATESDAGLITTYESGTSSTYTATESDAESSTRSSSVTQQERESDNPIIYVAGSLSTLVLVFGALIIVLSILYLCKFRNREKSKSQLLITFASNSHF
jgi:hypothetical protein